MRIVVISLWCCVLIFTPFISSGEQDVELSTKSTVFEGTALARFLEDRNHTSIIEFEGDYDRNLPDGSFNSEARAVIAQEFFANHPDEVDFLIVFTTFEFETGNALAFHVGIRNDVSGIGLPLFDNSADFGSNGVLQSYIDMAALSRYELDPVRPEFDQTLGVLMHEILHRFTASVRFVDEIGDTSTDLLSSDLKHWSFLLDSDGSLMYGNDWRDNGDGTFTSIAVRHLLSPLDLYLGGFYRAGEVPPMLLITNPELDLDQLPTINATVGGVARTVTIDDIIAEEGPRIPSADLAQHDFRVAFILAMRPGEAIDVDHVAALENVRTGLLNRFPILTDGRAVLNVFPPDEPGVEVGAPTPVTGGDVRPGFASIADGLTWLRSQQSANGFWQDTEETAWRDTAVTLNTLRAQDPFFAGEGAALVWLSASSPGNADDFARSILSQSLAGVDTAALRSDLLDLGNEDGGWGLGVGYGSDPLDTAMVALALSSHPDVSQPVLDSIGDFLIASQGNNGGWGHLGDSASRVSVTTTVLRALKALGRETEVSGPAVTWLASRQNPDGGFGDSPSTAHDTANALLALMDIGATGAVNSPAAMNFLDSTQTILGSWEGSTYTTSLVVAALKRYDFPNWALVAMSADPTHPQDGDEVLISADLVNDGNAFTPAGTIRLFLGDPDAGGIAIGDLAIPVLAPGATATAHFLWDSTNQAGTHTLVGVVDPNSAVDEANEGDNRGNLVLVVDSPPDGVDLTVRQGELTVTPPQPNTLPVNLVVTTTAENFGTADAGNVTVVLWQGEAGNGIRVAEMTANLPARSSAPVSLTYSLTAPGSTLLTIEIDPDNTVNEVDETNNSASTVVTTTPSIDFEVHDADLALADNPYFGHDVTFSARFRNRGTVDAPPATVRYLITDGVDETDLRIDTESLAAGQEVERTLVWRVDRLGNLRFVIQLDPEGAVTERDETNNGAGFDFSSLELDAVNLALTYSDLSFDPDPALEGSAVTLNSLVRNNGNQLVSSAEAVFFDGDPDVGGTQIGSTLTLPDLAAGASTAISIPFGPVSGPTDHLIFVVVDPANVVPESDEDDNRAFRTLAVLSLPDLAISTSGVVVSPRFPDPNGAVSVTVDIANLGEQDATNFLVRLTGDGAALAPDQTVSELAAGEIAQVVFNWTFPAAGGSIKMATAVDPDDAISEGAEDNNIVTQTVLARDTNDPLTDRYISPNGDGIQDTTTFFFTLAQSGIARAQVRNERGEIVRLEDEVVASPDGGFEWNGRDDLGRVSPDGDYRLEILDDGALVADALVTVDTNRSPMLDALGTQYERLWNQTCGTHDLEGATMPPSEDRMYYYRQRTPPEGIFRSLSLRQDPERVLYARRPGGLRISDDGSWMAYDEDRGYSTRRIEYARSDGSQETFVTTVAYGDCAYEVLPNTGDLIYYSPFTDEVRRLTMGVGGSAQTVFDSTRGRFFLSPDGEVLVLRTNTGFSLARVDTGALTEFTTRDSDFDDGWNVSWSPDSTRFAVIDNFWNDRRPGDLAGHVRVFGRTGDLIRTFEFFFQPMGTFPEYADTDPIDPSTIGFMNADAVWEPSWSSSSTEFVFNVAYEEWAPPGDPFASFGLLYRANVASGELEIAGFNQPWFRGTFHVSTWNGSSWVERGTLAYGSSYSERELELGNFLPDPDGEYKVRIRQTGHDAAHIERVALRVGERNSAIDLQPARAVDSDSHNDVLTQIERAEREVLDAHDRTIEVAWDDPSAEGLALNGLRLALAAQEETSTALADRTIFFPPHTDQALTYAVRDCGRVEVDGAPTSADVLTEPLFKELTRPGNGQPTAKVAGWVTSDLENLYGALDLTIDNTQDGDMDWASIWIETSRGWQEYRISADESTWGKVGFTRTGRAIYNHKYYEFTIPFSELGISDGATVNVRFAAGNSYAATEANDRFVPDYPEQVTWVPHQNAVLISQWFDVPWLIHLDDGNRAEIVLEEHDGFNDQRFSPSGKKLMFKSTLEILDPANECYNSQADWYSSDWWLYESLANLTTELRAEPAPDGRSFLLKGTAADLHFAHFRLEYANEEAPGFWTAIGPASDVQVFDDLFTVWVPPGVGSYLVRLSVEDLAGNVRRVIRRIAGAWNASAITDLWLDPRYFSPNGDSVQDETVLHYRVLQPAHLDVNVFNEHGDQVRTFHRDHSTIGAEIDVTWNGRDDNGLPVPDGEYRIEVQSFRFWVTVDTKPPVLQIDLEDALAEDTTTNPSSVNVAPRVSWCIDEDNFRDGLLLSGEGANPIAWTELRSLTADQACHSQNLSLNEFVNHSFRIEATDLAGNGGIATTSLGSQELILEGIGWPEPGSVPFAPTASVSLPHGKVRLAVAESLRHPLVGLTIQVRPAGETVWLDLPQPGALIEPNEFELIYDMNEVQLGIPTQLRLRCVDDLGLETFSNLVTFATKGIGFFGLVDFDDFETNLYRDALTEAMTAAGLNADRDVVLWAREAVTDPLVDVTLALSSEEDPNFAGTVPIAVAATAAGPFGDVFVFTDPRILPCRTYTGFVVATTTPDTGNIPYQSGERSFRLPCLDLKVSVSPVLAETCGAAPPELTAVSLTPLSYNDVELRTLTLAVNDPGNVIFNVNLPVNGMTYDSEIDTSAFAEGRHALYFRLSNGDGDEFDVATRLVVDRTAPVVAISYPIEGQRLCALPRGDHSYVGIEGSIDDFGGGFEYLFSPATLPPGGGCVSFALPSPAGAGCPSGLPQPPATPFEPLTDDGVHGALAELVDPNGEVTLSLDVIDWGGHRACADVTFLVDGLVEGANATTDRNLFSPNGDAIADGAVLTATAIEPFSLDIVIFEAIQSSAGWQPTGFPLRVLADDVLSLGSLAVPWDGRDDGGAVLPDGMYAAVFTLVDACGNRAGRQTVMEIDNTPPLAQIATPLPGPLSATMVEIWGTVSDPHLLDFSLHFGIGANPTSWSQLGFGNQSIADFLLALWSTDGLVGDHTLRLWARDTVGNQFITFVTVNLSGSGGPVELLKAVPNLISPNGDGNRDASLVHFALNQESTVALAIINNVSVVVRSLVADELLLPGTDGRIWNGLSDAATPVADGAYKARIQASTGGGAFQEEAVTIIVDATAPQISLTRPADGWASGSGDITGSIRDDHISEYSVYLTATPATPSWSLITTGTTEVFSGSLGSLEGRDEGSYSLRIEAMDLAENTSDLTLDFAIDNTAPVVQLTAPEPNAAVTGAISVTGSVIEANPASWRLEMGAGAFPTIWLPLASGAGSPSWPIVWDTAPIADGSYVLRLVAEDLAHNSGEASAPISIDHTMPIAALTDPVPGDSITAPMVIEGIASDNDLKWYRVALAPQGTQQWTELGVGASVVAGGALMAWNALPPDGQYTVRLTVEDRAGNHAVATANVIVDTLPPAPPTGLQATLDGTDVDLSWAPNSESDLAGYRVLREGYEITADVIGDAAHTDANVAEGTYQYTVIAVDLAGNRSTPSVPAEIVVDLTPPAAAILAPASGNAVGGLVDIRVTAMADDLDEYRLFANGEVLFTSTLAVQAEIVTQWNTLTTPDGPATLRLEAEDIRNNIGVAEITVTVDNVPPSAPTGLTADATGADVDLDWTVNPEPDVLGYLLYRNGSLINVPPDPGNDLRPYAIVGATHTDPGLPDGAYSYVVVAIDETGNISPPSAPATVDIDLRPPQAVIIQPDGAARIGGPTFVLATCPDLDVSQLVFQYQPIGDTLWTDIGAGTAPPWEITWDPTALAYGDYLLRAVATDLGGQTDAAPAAITVTYTDLERPEPVQNLAALVDGGDVNLSWTANSEPDLDGYHINRVDEFGTSVRITATPVPATTYVDSGVADGTYSYVVFAIDQYDNESNASDAVPGVVYTPSIDQPFSPTQTPSVNFSGAGAALATADCTVTDRDGNTTLMPPVANDAEGLFTLTGVPLALGRNDISTIVSDAVGNRSKAALFAMYMISPPSSPTGLSAVVNGFDVDLSWNTNPELNIIGYRVFRDGTLLTPSSVVVSSDFTGTSASSVYNATYAADRAVDGNTATYWSPLTDAATPAAGQWWLIDWGGGKQITAIEIRWWRDDYRAIDFDIEARHLGGWMKIAEVRGNADQLTRIELPLYYNTDGLRIVLRTIARPDTDLLAVRLAEISLEQLGMVVGPSFADTAPHDGFFNYSVTALNAIYESSPADPLEVAVGDVVPPDPVVLSAAVANSDVTLDWTTSSAPDLWGYHLYRDGARIAEITGATYLDSGLPNGDYTYVVRAVDLLGNASDPSNAESVTVDVALLPAPINFSVTAPETGGALDLIWQPGTGPAPLGFQILRSLTSGGSYEVVATQPGSTYSDYALTNGTTYYYVVTAIDAVGNPSPPSNEDSGTPNDLQAPAAPAISYPASPDTPYRTGNPLLPLMAGTAEPGALVHIFRNGTRVAQTQASADADALYSGVTTWAAPRLSPTGRYLWLEDRWDSQIFDFVTGSQKAVAIGEPVRWFAANDRAAFVEYDSTLGVTVIRSYDASSGATQDLAITDYADLVVPSPDGTNLAVLGGHTVATVSETGLWQVDLASGTWRLLIDGLRDWDVDLETFQYSPDGHYVAYLRTSPVQQIEFVDVATDHVTAIPNSNQTDTLSWALDGQELIFNGPDANWYWQVTAYQLATGTVTTLTAGDHDREVVRSLADGQSVVYVLDGQFVMHHDLNTGIATPMAELVSWDWVLDTVPSGYILLQDDLEPIRLTPTGRWQVANLALNPGDNPFTARAIDGATNQSPMSEEAVVTLLTSDLPDLAIPMTNLRVTPAAPIMGETARLSVTVDNLGEVMTANAGLSVVLVAPDGSFSDFSSGLELTPIGGGASQTLFIDVVLGGQSGAYSLIAVADPLDRVDEISETNNRGEMSFVVLADAGPELSVATDRSTYSNNDDVSIALQLINGGDDFNGRLEIRIEDQSGYPADMLPIINIVDFAYGQTLTWDEVWNIGDLFAGAYRVRARLFNQLGAPVTEAHADFTIAGSLALGATIITDWPTYTSGANVHIEASVSYAGNTVLSGAFAHLRLLDSASNLVTQWDRNLGDMLPGSTSGLSFTWNSVGAAPGPYRLDFWVERNSQDLVNAHSTFELTLSPPQISGTLALSPPTPAVGVALEASVTISNHGVSDLSNLPMTIILLDPRHGLVIDSFNDTLFLGTGATASGKATFSTTNLGLNSYLILLQADIEDGTRGIVTVTLATVSFATADRTPPYVTINLPQPGGFVGVSRRAVLSALDALSMIESSDVSVDSGPWQSLTPYNPAFGQWSRVLSDLTEGDHYVSGRATDAWSNTAETDVVAFTADFTPPLIVITGVVDGETYLDPVTPLVEIVEDHPANETITLNGVPFVSGTEVSDEGAYLLIVVAEDAAHNHNEARVLFTIGAPPVPELYCSKTGSLAVDADNNGIVSPGDELGYTIVLNVNGGGTLTNLEFEDTLPAGTTCVPGSVTTTHGSVAGENPVRVMVDAVAAEDAITINLRAVLDGPFDEGATTIANQGVVVSDQLPDVLTDDPDVPGAADPTATVVIAEPQGQPVLVVHKIVTLVDDIQGDGEVSPGDIVEYVIAVTNTGAAAATGVNLYDPIPDHTIVVPGSVSVDSGTVLLENPVQVWLGAIISASARDIRFRVTIDPDLLVGVTPVSNQAQVTSVEIPLVLSDDPGLSGDADPTVISVVVVEPAQPDLVVVKTASLIDDIQGDGDVSPGDTIEYAITINNQGAAAATDVNLQDTIPNHTTVVPGSVIVDVGAVMFESPVQVALGDIASTTGREVRFRVTVDLNVPSDLTEISNQAELTSVELPPVLSDDPSQPGDADPTVTPIVIEALNQPALVVHKTSTLINDLVGDGEASPGDVVEYSVTVTNEGDAAATDVNLYDAIPLHTDVIPGSVMVDDGVVQLENPVEVALGDIEPTEGREIRFRVTITEHLPAPVTEIANQAQVSSVELPTVLSDDPDTSATGDPTVITVNHLIAAAIPLLDGRGMTLLILMILFGGTFILRRWEATCAVSRKRTSTPNGSSR